MADYWKSNPRHFCTFCKCWIADNKPSRDFHERGKNHQKNVQLKISEVRKKAYKDDKLKEEHSGYFKQMEEEAKKAFLKDLKSDPKLAQQYLKKTQEKKKVAEKPKSEEGQSGGSHATVESATQETERSKSEEEQSVSGGVTGTWRLTYSPEGYPYYWNDITAEVSWTLPEGVTLEESEPGETTSQPVEADTDDEPDSTETSTKSVKDTEYIVDNTSKDTNNDKTKTADKETVKDSTETQHGDKKDADTEADTASNELLQASNFDLGDISSIPLPGEIPLPKPTTDAVVKESPQDQPKVQDVRDSSTLESTEDDPEDTSKGDVLGRSQKRGHDSAYGQWETVQEQVNEPVDLELPETKQTVEEKVIVVSEPKLKFREKKVSTLGADLVAFKKRKMNSRNLKQRQDT